MYEKMYKSSNYRGISYAAWVHGNVAVCESCLQNGIITDVKGWGTKFTFEGEMGTKFWVHFPITTPVIVQDKKLELERVFIL